MEELKKELEEIKKELQQIRQLMEPKKIKITLGKNDFNYLVEELNESNAAL